MRHIGVGGRGWITFARPEQGPRLVSRCGLDLFVHMCGVPLPGEKAGWGHWSFLPRLYEAVGYRVLDLEPRETAKRIVQKVRLANGHAALPEHAWFAPHPVLYAALRRRDPAVVEFFEDKGPWSDWIGQVLPLLVEYVEADIPPWPVRQVLPAVEDCSIAVDTSYCPWADPWDSVYETAQPLETEGRVAMSGAIDGTFRTPY